MMGPTLQVIRNITAQLAALEEALGSPKREGRNSNAINMVRPREQLLFPKRLMQRSGT